MPEFVRTAGGAYMYVGNDDHVCVEVKVHFPEGHQPRVAMRTWTFGDVREHGPPELGDPADCAFLTNPRRAWPHPRGPITFEADAVPGREYDAQEWLDLL